MACSNLKEVKVVVEDGRLELGSHQAGEKLEVTCPVPVKEEELAIGTPGRRQCLCYSFNISNG